MVPQKKQNPAFLGAGWVLMFIYYLQEKVYAEIKLGISEYV